MLLLGLLAAPAGAALLVTDRPYPGLALSALLGVIDVWAGLGLARLVPNTPASFWIMAVAGAVYAAAMAYARIRRGRGGFGRGAAHQHDDAQASVPAAAS
jgi:zinc/manganese transport system permease protein